jgi:hypothetical protein
VPFLRIIRDKRGYETTYLMHWYREGNKQRSRILYVFRSPGGVRVGRDALEPDVLRYLEEQYPDIDFDWKSVVENQQVVEPHPEQRRLRKRRRGDEDQQVASSAANAGTPPQPSAPAAPAPPRPSIPSTIDGSTPDEQIAFLTTWYPVVRERVPRRTSDPARQEALLALAERLNPGNWTDADQITVGLQQAAEALERLSRVFSNRRRRSRRRGKSAVADRAGDPAAERVPDPTPDPTRDSAPDPESPIPDPESPDS